MEDKEGKDVAKEVDEGVIAVIFRVIESHEAGEPLLKVSSHEFAKIHVFRVFDDIIVDDILLGECKNDGRYEDSDDKLRHRDAVVELLLIEGLRPHD